MKFRKSLSQFSIAGSIATAIVFGALGNQPSNAQFSDCVNAGSQTSNAWNNESRDVSIGREMYKSVAYMRPYRDGQTVVTCRLDPTPGSTYGYAIGFEDKDSSNTYPAQIIVYLNGNEISRQTIRPGQLYSRLIDTAGARSVSIEAVCTRTSGCRRLSFVQLGAESPRSSLGQR